MNKFIFIWLFCLFGKLHAQQPPAIPITYNKFVYLIFPTEVQKFDLGIGSVFAEFEGNILKLIPRASKIPDASLFVTTEQGHYYFIVKLEESGELENYTHQVKGEWMAAPLITSEEVEGAVEEPIEGDSREEIIIKSEIFNLSEEKQNELSNNLEKVYEMDVSRIEIGKIDPTIGCYIGTIAYDKSFIYLTVIVENDATIDYNLDFIKFFIESKTGAKKKTDYEEELVPVGELIKETTVSKDEVQKYVFAFEKFTITKEKELRVEIWESEGDRNSILNVKSKYILNARLID
ncbi:MAG: DUF4138 domain-containing protein [Cyclobacteriaceae bacterium]